ncbi:hypothetical protein TWF970_011532 [Orbilia oligospora]|uniref:C2H2-type domain-containing protein n=1 Tax=Orbilia oligospora TaxID=2813651 RepID=A0A7C8RID5_ORBOL|nr:hypothetical protein TWF970_011532 [Orbilia oligospora]
MEGAASRILNSSRNISRDSQMQTEVEELLDVELPRAVRNIARKGARQRELTGDFLTDSGDFITYALELLDEVATVISDRRRIRAYLSRKLAGDDDSVDLDDANDLDKRRSALIYICRELKDTSTNINQIWENTLSETQPISIHTSRNTYTSFQERRRSSVPSSAYTQESPLPLSPYNIRDSGRAFDYPSSHLQPSPLASQPSNGQFAQRFLDSEDHDEQEEYDEEDEEEDMPSYLDAYGEMEIDRSGASYQARRTSGSTPASLSSPGSIDPGLDLERRGTGNYVCRLEWQCRKGGVVDEELVVFKRNSDYRRHMNKHDKPYKCDIPGCKNTAGFSRLDQLNRHKVQIHTIKLY